MSATDNARRALEEYGRAEYKRGYNDGYERALQTIIASAQEWLDVAHGVTKPTPAVEANDAADAAAADLPPYLTRALDYLKEHPGVTAWKASVAIRNQAALYELHKKGLARKEGTKFYPA